MPVSSTMECHCCKYVCIAVFQCTHCTYSSCRLWRLMPCWRCMEQLTDGWRFWGWPSGTGLRWEWCMYRHADICTYVQKARCARTLVLYCILADLPLQVCMLDDKESGLYPSLMFVAMVVYFLQQKARPVLPVLHEVRAWGSKWL